MAGEEETFWLNWSGMVNLVQNIVKNFEYKANCNRIILKSPQRSKTRKKSMSEVQI